MFELAPHCIFVALAGSQAHGTARAGSDMDVRGVCVAPMRVRLSLFESFEQREGPIDAALMDLVGAKLRTHPTAAAGLLVKAECVVFDVAKLVGLCAAANPNALEILFADECDWLFETAAWRRLHTERHRFLTKKVQQTFLGYGLAQLKKIQTHRSWLLDPPKGRPERIDFGLPDPRLEGNGGALGKDDENRIEQSIADRLRSYGIDDIEMPPAARIAVRQQLERLYRDLLGAPEAALDERMRALATNALQLPVDVINALNAERRYRAAARQWQSYETWKAQRNPARAELERAHGYDTKHAMHLVRLMRMGLEVLQRGDLSVRRADAAELAAIRDGALSFEALSSAATQLQADMLEAAKVSPLPDDIDREHVDGLLRELIEGAGMSRRG